MYRRRRLLVLLGVLAVIVAVVLIIVKPGASQGEPATTPGATPTDAATTATDEPAESTEPTPSEPPAEDGAACTAEQITVVPVTDQSSYAAAEKPELSVTLVNTGTNECIMNAGTKAQVFTITSGDDVYWTSTDCQTDAVDAELSLAAGDEISSSVPLIWDRTRSNPDTCDGPRESVPAGGASYYLDVTVDGFASEAGTQFLLY